MTDQVDIEDVVDIVASDEKLFRYIMKLVRHRLPRNMRKDNDWCTKVIDISIQSALQEIRVVDIVKNMMEQRRQQQQEFDEIEDDLLLPQLLSDSEDERSAIAPFEEENDSQSQNSAHKIHAGSENLIVNENLDHDDSSRSSLNNSNVDDSTLRPHFSDNEPSTVSINSPKRILRGLNKYKDLPDSRHPQPSEEIEPVMSLEIETDNLQNRSELNGNSEIDESVQSRAESEASTVQIIMKPGVSPVINGWSAEDSDTEGSNYQSQLAHNAQIKSILSYDSEGNTFSPNEDEYEAVEADAVAENSSRRYIYSDRTIDDRQSSEIAFGPNEALKRASMDGNLPISESPFLNMADDDEDDRVLLGESVRQSQENCDIHQQEDNVRAEEEEQGRLNNDLELWESKIMENIRQERELEPKGKGDQNFFEDKDESVDSGNHELERNSEIFVVPSPPLSSLRVHISPSSSTVEPKNLSSPLSSSHATSPSTASPDRLKTRVPNRNILVHQTSPSNPAAFYAAMSTPESDSSPASLRKSISQHESPLSNHSSPARKGLLHRSNEEERNDISDEYSFGEFHPDASHISPQADTKEKPHHAENVEEELYEDDYHDDIPDESFRSQNNFSGQINPFEYSIATTKGKKKRVAFLDDVVSEVHYRDKINPLDKKWLFYAHEDEWRFGEDQFREIKQAEKMGLAWVEWVEKYHHDHDDGLSEIVGRGESFQIATSADYSHNNRSIDMYTNGEDEFEMAEDDSDGGIDNDCYDSSWF
jgi:hypothetical protein